MKKYTSLLFLLFILLLPTKALGEEPANYMVMFEEEINWSLVEELGIQATQTYKNLPALTAVLNGEQLTKLKDTAEVTEIHEEREYQVRGQVVPWGIKAVKEDATAAFSPFTGKGVKVAVLDTGISKNHPDLKVKGGVCVLDSSCYGGYDDDNGHGTHVAGVIAAQNNTIGTVGLAPGVDLYAVKAFDDFGDGTTSTILNGIDWAITNKMDIINLSVTTEANDPVLKAMLQKAADNGILLVAAAGNAGQSDGTKNNILYPAKYSNVIAVGSVNSKLQRTSLSSTGPELEFVAPGETIYSTIPKDLDFDGKPDGYTTMSGTSMATPFVTGSLALLKEQYPQKTAQQLREMLQASAKDLGAPGRDIQYGFGLVQAKRPQSNLPTGNSVTLAESAAGKVEFNLQKTEDITNVTVKRADGAAQKVSGNQWIDYVPKGTYEYLFTFTNRTGNTYQALLKVNMTAPELADVKAGNWYSKYMVYLHNQKIIRGVNGGTYLMPTDQITRGEATALVGRAQHVNGTQRATAFKDVTASYFASGYIQSAFEQKWISGFGDKTYRANQPVTRAEMAILISRAYDLPSAKMTNPFTDVSAKMAGSKEILALAEAGITTGYTATTFAPHKYITRAEFSAFLAKAENPEFLK
ncbi:MAG TPA: S8 family serine peptidase [Chondromyces sp.]|nr:S8 family serine peptidase [Chondromyces sp.]